MQTKIFCVKIHILITRGIYRIIVCSYLLDTVSGWAQIKWNIKGDEEYEELQATKLKQHSFAFDTNWVNEIEMRMRLRWDDHV